MNKTTKTQIYEDDTFFGDYLDSTSEKDQFVKVFIQRIHSAQIKSVLDLGCYDGSLTVKIVKALECAGQNLVEVTAVEPAAGPLEHLKRKSIELPKNIKWNFVNSSMEDYLASVATRFDCVIASHSLYWMGENTEILKKIASIGTNAVLVMRDSGLLHEVEVKYRPLMTSKIKRFISSAQVMSDLKALQIPFETESIRASMAVTDPDSIEFKNLAGFLLDLTLAEVKNEYLPQLYKDLNVVNGRSYYGIDIIWLGEHLK